MIQSDGHRIPSSPPTVRLFLFLLIKDKVLARDVMRRRNFHCELECEMCNLNQAETTLHLFFQCGYALSIWRTLGMAINNRSQMAEELAGCVCQRSDSDIVCDLGNLESRNLKVFEDKKAPIDVTVQWIVHEATLWKRFC